MNGAGQHFIKKLLSHGDLLMGFLYVKTEKYTEKYVMCFLFRITGLLGLALFLVGLTEVSAEAQSSPRVPRVSQLSPGTFSNLRTSANRFRRDGTRTAVQFRLPIKSGRVEIALEPHDIRSPSYKSLITGPHGTYRDPVQVDLFKGSVKRGHEDSKDDFARFAIITHPGSGRQTFKGVVRAKNSYYAVRPFEEDNEELVVEELSTEELNGYLGKCGTITSLASVVQSHSHRDNVATAMATAMATGEVGIQALQEAQIATEADKEYTDELGGTESSANSEILSILNSVDAIYQDQLEITFTVTFQHAWTTTSDPYTTTNSDDLLDEFYAYWETNYRDAYTYDVAHLWTGKDLDSSVVGLAAVDAVCRSYAYGLTQRIGSDAYDVPITAHELGHNFGSNHDSCLGSEDWVMCPFVVTNATEFSPDSQSQISSYLSSVSCLTDVDTPGPGENAPVLASIGSQSVAENATLTFTISATDADADTLTYSAASLPSGASFNTSTRVFTYSPSYSVVEDGETSTTKSVTFAVSDGTGLSDSETVVITVSNTNRSPTLEDPSDQTIGEGQKLTVSLAASDPDDDSLTYVTPNGLPDGAILNWSTGVLTWRPGGSQSGTYSISVRAKDPYGSSSSQTFTITVTDVPGATELPASHHFGDFNGNGEAKVVVFRSTSAMFYWNEFGDSGANSKQLGTEGDVPVPQDYNGDNITDFAVYSPATSTWSIRYSRTSTTLTYVFGSEGDIPAPADFDGDGRADFAVFRAGSGIFLYQKSTTGSTVITTTIGSAGDIPVPGDYDGNGRAEVAVYSPETGTWILANGGLAGTYQHGTLGDIAVPADYDGDGDTDMTVWRPSTGQWRIRNVSNPKTFGAGGDVPVAADYDGDGDADYVFFRPSTMAWHLRQSGGSSAEYQLGLDTDQTGLMERAFYAARESKGSSAEALSGAAGNLGVFRGSTQTLYSVNLSAISGASVYGVTGSYILYGDYNGDSLVDTASFSNGVWYIYYNGGAMGSLSWGLTGDVPVSGDFDGDGSTDIAIYRADGGAGVSQWWVLRSSTGLGVSYSWGLPGDSPVPGDFNGDGWTDPAVWRSSTGTWYPIDARSSQALPSMQWGLAGDLPRVADFDQDGRADKVVWRESVGTWFVNYSSGGSTSVQWGLPGDIPVPGTFASTSASDYAVYRPSTGVLYVLTTEGLQYSLASGLLSTDQVVATSPNSAVR